MIVSRKNKNRLSHNFNFYGGNMFNKRNKSRLLLGAAVSALMLGSAVSTAIAEDYTTGSINGVVRDEAGTVVQGATITFKSNKGVVRTITSNKEGKFRAPLLAVGTYVATISKEGYNELSGQKIAVTIGSSGEVTFTLDSELAGIEEVFVVGTRRAGYDFNTTTTGLTVSVDDLFAKTPIARDTTAIALLAPGTGTGDSSFAGGNGQALVSIGGSSVGENIYYVNGMNITNFRNFLGGSTIPFEFFDQVEIKTGGYQAEFGRATGGVINAVTKSGSNDFHFGANVFWQGDSFRSKSQTVERPGSATLRHLNTREHIDYNFSLSGPILEDRLFFYALYNPRSIKTESYSHSQKITSEKTDPFWALKFDLNLFEGHHLEATFFSDNQTRTLGTYKFNSGLYDSNGRTSKSLEDVDAQGDLGSFLGNTFASEGGINKIFKYTGVLSDWITVSALYGINRYNRTTVSETDDLPVIYDSRNGCCTALGDWASFFVEKGEDERESFRFDADVYFEAMGDHHVRLGFDRENLTADNVSQYSGGAYYRYYSANASQAALYGIAEDTEYVRVRRYFNGGKLKTQQSAFYIQDSWQIADDLTLNLGLRNDSFKNLNAAGEQFIETKNQWAPRLGFSWDATGDGLNRVSGSWGRYYLPIATNTNIRMASAEDFTANWYLLDGVNTDGTPLFDTANLLDSVTYANGDIPNPVELVDENINPMYTDEFILGYEHDFENGWVVGVRGVYRKMGRLIEDVAIDAAVPVWAAQNGYDPVIAADFWSGFHQYVLTNPGSDMTISLAKEGLTGNSADAGEFIVATLPADMLNYPEGTRTYKAIDITFAREWDGKWSLEGSYTMSWLEGNYEGSVKSDNGQDDAGITTDFDQPGLMDGSFGWLPNDRRHRFKIWGAYAVTEEIMVSANFALTSPRKQGCIGLHPTDVFAQAYGKASWYCDSVLTPRASQMETDWIKKLDVGISFTPDLNKHIPGNVVFKADIFNLFNTKGVTDRAELEGVNYGYDSGFQAPRQIRFSASFKY